MTDTPDLRPAGHLVAYVEARHHPDADPDSTTDTVVIRSACDHMPRPDFANALRQLANHYDQPEPEPTATAADDEEKAA